MRIYDDCVVINDAFPKARCHALVIARQEGLEGPADLRPEHLPLLRSMQVALQIICPIQNKCLLHVTLGCAPFPFHCVDKHEAYQHCANVCGAC